MQRTHLKKHERYQDKQECIFQIVQQREDELIHSFRNQADILIEYMQEVLTPYF